MEFESELKTFFEELNKVKKEIKAITNQANVVNSSQVRQKIGSLGSEWFSKLKPSLISTFSFSGDSDVIKKRDAAFEHLVLLSANPSNKKSGYLNDIKIIQSKVNTELFSPLKTRGVTSSSAIDSAFDSVLSTLDDEEQSEYLKEAIDCAKNNYLKASVVLGWCACIDHIHNKIDEIGYPTFNITSARLASQKGGRFKRYNSTYNISSLSELRPVFDRDILVILEGLQLVDTNQGDRLRSCFEMRNHSGHPGEAPITPYNVMSFYSDIIEIVLMNPKFKLAKVV